VTGTSRSPTRPSTAQRAPVNPLGSSVSQSSPERTGQERFGVISDGMPSQLPDVDPAETAEWLESLDAVVDSAGRQRARFLMLKLLERSREKNVGVPALRSTD
jgi:hypothetical protein